MPQVTARELIGSKLKVVLAAVVVLISSLVVAGCKNEKKPANLQPQAVEKQENKRYNLRGQVVAKDAAANEITVQHDEIPGFMAAMTMPYKVKDPATVQEVEPGDKIAAEVVVANDGSDYWLEDVRITEESGRKKASSAPSVHRLNVGEHVPNLPLVNQDGKTIHLDDFRGKALLVTFIYTRCPLPNFCPRLSSQFAKIHDDLAKTPDDYRKTHLLTITFDPKYDTAPVLRKYGLAYLDDDPAGFGYWDFAFTTPGDLRKLADAFGLMYFEEENQISHTMNIALIAPDGTVSKYWSQEWTTSELEDALRQEARSAAAVPPRASRGRTP
jgi:protein SCO1/2